MTPVLEKKSIILFADDFSFDVPEFFLKKGETAETRGDIY